MKKHVVVIDNYDSFTYNLVQYLGELGVRLSVFRNDAIALPEIERMRPDSILISPGPGEPKDAGISCEVIQYFAKRIPILGVCLGHQCIGFSYGGKIVQAKVLMHGKTSLIHHSGRGIFKGIDNPFSATRYHSLVIERKSLPKTFSVIAETKDREMMAIKHKRFPLWGVQFHPESILTSEGKKILKNFLDGVK